MYRKFNPLLYFIVDPSLCHGRAVEDVVADADAVHGARR